MQLIVPVVAQSSWLALSTMADQIGIYTLTTPTGLRKHFFLTFLSDSIAPNSNVWSLSQFQFRRIHSSTIATKGQLVKHNVTNNRTGKSRGGNAEKVVHESTISSESKATSSPTRRSSICDQAKRIVSFLKQLGIRNQDLDRCLRHANELSEEDLMKLMATLRFLGLKRAELRALLSKRPSLIKAKPAQVECVFRYFLGLGFNNGKTIQIWVQWPALIDSDLEIIKNMINYLVSVGIQTEELQTILSRRPQILEHNLVKVKFTVCALLDSGISQIDVVTLLKRVPEIFSSSEEDNVHASLNFWLSVGVEGQALCKALIRRPNLLNYDIEKMKVNYQFMQGWMKPCHLRKLLNKYAEVLSFDSKTKLEPLIMYLLGLGVEGEAIGKIIARRPQLLACTTSGLDRTVNYLMSLGVKDDMFGKIITLSPQVLTLNADEKLKQGIEFFQSIGLDKEGDMELLFSRNAQVLCCSIERNLQPKMDFFLKTGLPKEVIANMIVLFPSMLGHNIDHSLAPKYNYLVKVMKRAVQELANFPQYFGYSLENRIKPRHEKLERKGIHTSLASMLACTDDDFQRRYMVGSPPIFQTIHYTRGESNG